VITILVVGGSADAESFSPDASIEVLRARDAGQAVERLARNRRIDAILLLSGERNGSILGEIADQELSPPPVYAPRIQGVPSGARPLEGVGLADFLGAIASDLGD
jgi:hypothetical protein